MSGRLYPLTSVQRGVWLDQALHGRTVNMGAGLRIDGRVDADALREALQVLVNRHDALRMVLRKGEDLPWQEFLPQMPVTLQRVNLRGEGDAGAEEWMRREMARSFPMLDARPFHFALVSVADDRHFWFHKYNHLVMDGHGNSLMSQWLAAIYTNIVRGLPVEQEATFSYADYVSDDLDYVASERHADDVRYWGEKFAELPAPLVEPKAIGTDIVSHRSILMLPRPFYDRIQPLAAAYGASTFHLFLAAVYIYFCRIGRRDELCIGTATVHRPTPAFKKTIGLFTGATPAWLRFGRDLSTGQLLQAIARALRKDYRHLRLPLFEISHAAGLHRHRRGQLADVAVTYQKQSYDVRFDGHPAELISISHGAERTPLVLEVCEYNETLDVRVNVDYRADAFTDEEIEQFEKRFVHLIDEIVARPDAPIAELSLVPPKERHLLITGFNADRVTIPPEATLLDLFDAQRQRRSDATALIFDESTLTYAQLDARANQLARHLRERGVAPGSVVGVCLDRSAELVISILAVLKTGGAYLPLDPFYPAERLAFMLGDAGAAALVTHHGLLPELQALDSRAVVLVDADASAIAAQDTAAPKPAIAPDSPAYVIYTSGSTGKPKGTIVTHHNVVRLFRSTEDLYRFDEHDVWTLFHSVAFDFSVWEMFGALLYGGTLVVVPYWVTRAPDEFHRLLRTRSVTVLNQTPSAFLSLMQVDASFDPPPPLTLRWLIFGGESLSVKALEPWIERRGDAAPRMVNMYGITETSVVATLRPLSASDAGEARSLIGRPLSDLAVYVLDERMEPVPLGVPGELFIGGDAVAVGYLNRPELDRERFLLDPFNGRMRLYRSGDLVRQFADGSLQYLGRIDDQVKLRGFRIELDEIRAAIEAHPAVREALVVVTAEPEPKLVAYVVPRDESAPSHTDLRASLRRTLPEYMIPAAFVSLRELPLTVNGKVDRRALPSPDFDAVAGATYVEPRRDIEKTIAGVWREILSLDKVGLHDNVFDLGGHSLHMIRARTRLEELFGLSLSMPDMFACPTVHALADFIGESGLTPAEKLVPRRQRRPGAAAHAPIQEPA